MKMTFEQYMQKVDAALETWCGLSSSDLDDYSYRDCYEGDVRPSVAASRALHNAGGYF